VEKCWKNKKIHEMKTTLLTFWMLMTGLAYCNPQIKDDQSTINELTGFMEQLKKSFTNPGNDYRPVPLGMDKKLNTDAYVNKLVQGRWGGAHARHQESGVEYLRDPAGWDFFGNLVKGCRDNQLKMWIYDENGYPSGRAGGHVLEGHPEFEAQGLFYDFKDIQVRDKKGMNSVQEVIWQIPEGTPFYVVRYALTREGHINGKPLDLTNSVIDGKVKLSLEPGSWRILAFVTNRLFDGTHAVLTGGPYINILDPDAVKRFIEITHESYYERFGNDFGKTINAVFNDEVSVMNGLLTDDTQPHPAIAWYDGFPDIFRKRTGYNIRNCLPALFDDIGIETTRKRCDFYSMLGQQIADAFFKQVREWCAKHKVASTGHLLWEESLIYHTNFYGTVFPSLKELDWPGIDVLFANYGQTSGAHTEGGPVTPKLASSAAHIWDKNRTMSESFWSVTNKVPIEEVMAHYAWQAVLGINTLTTLTMQNSYPDDALGKFNDFVGRLNYMLTQGRFTADVAILYPITSVWGNFKPSTRHVHNLNDNPKAKDVDEAWRFVSAKTLSCQRDFDYLDEELIKAASINGGKINIGSNSYSVLVMPHVTALGFETLKQIRKFAEDGGTVISWQTLPIFNVDSVSANDFQTMINDLWNNNRENVIHAMTEPALRKSLLSAGNPDFVVTPATEKIYYQHRILSEGDIYYIVNNSLETVSGEFALRGKGKAEIWNPLDGKMTAANTKKTSTGSTLSLCLNPRSSLFIVFN
jgi:hypothetical protein